MIEKIIDFVTLPFLFVTDLIDRCRCKHIWKLVNSKSDDNRVYVENAVHKNRNI